MLSIILPAAFALAVSAAPAALPGGPEGLPWGHGPPGWKPTGGPPGWSGGPPTGFPGFPSATASASATSSASSSTPASASASATVRPYQVEMDPRLAKMIFSLVTDILTTPDHTTSSTT